MEEAAACFSSAVSANTEAVTRVTQVQLRTEQGNLGAAENLTETGTKRLREKWFTSSQCAANLSSERNIAITYF